MRKCYVYEEENKAVIEIDPYNKIFKAVFTATLYDGCTCKQLSKSDDEKTLILNKNDKSLVLFYDFNNQGFDFSRPIKVEGMMGNEIRTAKAVDNNHIVTISDDGFMSIYRIMPEEGISKPVKFATLPLAKDEEVSSLAVSGMKDCIVIATSLDVKAYRIFIFDLEEDLTPIYSSEICFDEYKFAQQPLSFLQDLSVEYYIDGFPIILGFQFDADNLIVPLVFDKTEKKFLFLAPPKNYHTDRFCKAVYRKKDCSLWSIDKTGTVKRLSLIANEI